MRRIARVGIVESIRSDGAIVTIEGNTDDAGGRTGGRVMCHVRRANIAGYGLPAYTSAPHDQSHGGSPQRLAVDGELGPETRKALQRALGVTADGELGPLTIKGLQRKVGAHPDGEWGPATTRALQRALNDGTL